MRREAGSEERGARKGRPTCLTCLICLTCLTCLTSEEPPLVSAHRRQAAAIQPIGSVRPGAEDQLARLKADIAAKEKMWSERLAQPIAIDELLKGLPEAILTQVQSLAGDTEKARAALRQGVTLELLLALAAVRNPDVHASHQNWRAAVRRFDQASYLEDLVGTYRAFVRELDTKVGPQKHKEMPGKTFAFPSSLTLKGQIVDATAGVAWLNYQTTLRRTLNQTARAFFDVQYTTSTLPVLGEMKTLFTQISENARSRLETGTVSQADALKAQSELALIENRLATQEHERDNIIARVNTLLDLPQDAEWGTAAERNVAMQMPALADALNQGRAANQELLTARRNLELMQLMVRMAETEINPRASVGYSQLAPSVGAEAGPTRSKMATFPDRLNVSTARAALGANAAYLDELRVRVHQAADVAALAETKMAFAVKDALYRLDAAERNQKTYGEHVVPQTKQAMETLQSRYSSGGVPFIEFLDAGRSYLRDTLLLEGARREQNKAAVDLQDALGQSAARLVAAPGKE